MDDRHDHRDQRQRDHHHEERQVAEALALGHRDRHVAEDSRQRDERQDREDPPEGAAGQDQEGEGADGVERHPLACEGQPEQPADERHRDPERRPSAPPARPYRGEHRVGRHDEGSDVDVVHPDARLDEEHPVGEHEDADEGGHEPAPEEDPCEQVQAGDRHGAEDDARQPPRERVGAHLDRGDRTGLVEDEQLLPVRRRVVRLDVGGPGDRREVRTGPRVREDRTEPRVREDRVAVRLHDVDRPRAVGCLDGGRCRCIRRETQDVDHLAGVVVDHLGAEPRQRMRALGHRTARGVVATDDHHVVGRLGRRAGRHVELGVLEAGRLGQAVGAAIERDGGHDLRIGRIDEGDALGGRGRDPGHILDLDAGQAPVTDRLLDLGPHLARARVAEKDRWTGTAELGLEGGRVPLERIGEDGGLGGLVPEELGRGDDRGAVATVGDVHQARQVRLTDRRAGREVDRVQVIARPDHDGRPVPGDIQQVDGRADLPDRHGLDPGGGRVRTDGCEIKRGEPPVVEAGHEQVAARVDRQGRDTGRGDRRDELAAPQVVGPDLRSGGHVDALPAPATCDRRIVASWLDDRRAHGHAEVAGGADVVLAPGHDAQRHRVLGQVRMGPFVDVVREPVPPVLEELGGRPSVVDLVEVHLVRLGQPEEAQREARHDEHGEEPHVEPVQAATALADERCAAVRPDRSLAETVPEPAGDATLGQPERSRPRRHRRVGHRPAGTDGGTHGGTRARGDPGRREGTGSGERHPTRRPRAGPGVGRPPNDRTGIWRSGLRLDRRPFEVVSEPVASAGPELHGDPHEADRVEQDHDRDAGR